MFLQWEEELALQASNASVSSTNSADSLDDDGCSVTTHDACRYPDTAEGLQVSTGNQCRGQSTCRTDCTSSPALDLSVTDKVVSKGEIAVSSCAPGSITDSLQNIRLGGKSTKPNLLDF